MVVRSIIAGALLAAALAPLTAQAAPFISTPYPDLQWYYSNPGDYNQDGLVNASDMTALGRHFGTRTSGDFAPDSVLSVIDGDLNGELNQADLVTIARNWGHSALGGFAVMASGVTLPVGNVPLSAAQGDPARQRLQFAFTIPGGAPQGLSYYYSATPLDALGLADPARSININLPSPPMVYQELLLPGSSFDAATGTTQVHWYYFNLADGNQDREVGIGDLVTLAQNFNDVAPGGAGQPDPWRGSLDRRALIDCDMNGELNGADMTVLIQSCGRRVDGYNLYVTDVAAHYPIQPWAPSNLAPLATLDFEAGSANIFERLRFEATVPAGAPSRVWWVRPYAPGGWEGAPSPLAALN